MRRAALLCSFWGFWKGEYHQVIFMKGVCSIIRTGFYHLAKIRLSLGSKGEKLDSELIMQVLLELYRLDASGKKNVGSDRSQGRSERFGPSFLVDLIQLYCSQLYYQYSTFINNFVKWDHEEEQMKISYFRSQQHLNLCILLSSQNIQRSMYWVLLFVILSMSSEPRSKYLLSNLFFNF